MKFRPFKREWIARRFYSRLGNAHHRRRLINDWEDGLLEDIDEWVERMAPTNPKYKHHNTGEDNGDAHLKRLLINHQVTIPITEGKLDLGPWEQIFYAEFDGQRRKRLILKALGI